MHITMKEIAGQIQSGDFMDIENKISKEREEELQIIATLRLLDDDLMTIVFDRNIEATELLLNVILQRNDLKVTEVTAQREYKNPMVGGRSITIDIEAMDADGKVYDIEVQRASAGADAHRARFHSSMIDTKMLKEKQQFKEIRDSYVIFIVEHDVMGAGLALYHVDRMIKETGGCFNDGSHIIYVNGDYKDDNDPVGKLMHDFRCTSSVDMFYPILADQVKYFKETEGGRKIMSKAVEDFVEKRAAERAEKIAQEMAEKIAEEKAEKIAEKIAEEKAEKIAEEKAERIAEEKKIEVLSDSIKSLMENLKLTAEQAMVTLNVADKDKSILRTRL